MAGITMSDKHRKTKRSLIWVEFIDHSDSSHSCVESDITLDRTNETIQAVGWVIKENKEMLVLASWQIPTRENGDTYLRSYIVKGAITKRKRLKV